MQIMTSKYTFANSLLRKKKKPETKKNERLEYMKYCLAVNGARPFSYKSFSLETSFLGEVTDILKISAQKCIS